MRLPECFRCSLLFRTALAAAVTCAALSSGPSGAQNIYSCIDAKGRRITSDRPVPECHTRDQRVLNADGSVKTILPPASTVQERAEQEALERKLATEGLARQEALRRDRNLLRRFPDEASHNNARRAALDDVQKSVDRSERRLSALASERKPLEDEAEFYKGTVMPSKLRLQIDANDASVEAQRSLVQNQQSEMMRINALYDVELSRLKRLWAGAVPGSLGPLPTSAETAVKAQVPVVSGPAKLSPASSATAR